MGIKFVDKTMNATFKSQRIFLLGPLGHSIGNDVSYVKIFV